MRERLRDLCGRTPDGERMLEGAAGLARTRDRRASRRAGGRTRAGHWNRRDGRVTPASDTAPDGWLRRLLGYVRRHRRTLYLSLTGAVIGGLCQTVVPLVERQIVDGVIISRTSPLWPWLVLMAGVSVLGFAMSYLRRYNGGKVALQVQYDLRNAMHDHLQRMDTQTLEGMPTGQLVGRASSDSTLVQALLNYIPILSSNALLVVLSLG